MTAEEGGDANLVAEQQPICAPEQLPHLAGCLAPDVFGRHIRMPRAFLIYDSTSL